MDNQIPDDGFAPPPPMGASPEPDFADSKCLMGNNGEGCHHLWQLVTSFAHGNTAGTFETGKEPREIHRSCTHQKEMELKGLTVHDCNRHSDPAMRSNPKPFNFEEEE